jgi:hypothetical protein
VLGRLAITLLSAARPFAFAPPFLLLPAFALPLFSLIATESRR